ncbi:S26 family signal peptidase [Sphingomonas sp.]|uniref:S26 family signal peptidase n=1 Tax=Sphingomonas sp. TaxID=28214 RepID=UPI00307D6F3F
MARAVSEAGTSRWRPQWRLWLLFGGFVVGSLALGSLADWRDSHVFLINTTDSLPNWAFLIQRGRLPAKGDYVFFDPPTSALLRRHFGARPQMFGKLVYGMPGDIVGHAGTSVTINGVRVASMKPLTRFGEPLTPGATGPVPRGCYFAATPHKDGFDSRYAEIGFVCARQIIGTGVPVL